MKYIVLALISAFAANANAGTFIDTVYSFKPGTIQFVGQGTEYFPMNIFGPPSSSASRVVPASSPYDVCSIGIGGEIILGLKNGRILNGDGVDFIIFENAFERQIDGVVFAEPAIVSVSQNGIDFIEFPFNSWTLDGLAGKTPTNGLENPFDISVSGGDGFDLEVLGLDFITHIKLKDTSRIVSQDEKHPFYQPEFIVSGFDLDAIAIVHHKTETSITESKVLEFEVSEFSDRIIVSSHSTFNLSIFDAQGKKVLSIASSGIKEIDRTILPNGFLIFVLENGKSKSIHKLIN